jgi:hypothetical protein
VGLVSDWPDTLKVGPIGEWPGTLTPERQRRMSPFSATLSSTLRILDREIYGLVDTKAQQESAELLIAIPASQFRNDGRPYARAIAEHPGVILSLDSRHGHLSYPCDTFTTWQDNLRAVVLALEALRKVDRYGVTRRGEQYRGFLAIEATAMSADPFSDARSALAWLIERFPQPDDPTPATAVRMAKRAAHPDMPTGDAERFRLVMKADELLRMEGLL